MRDEKMETICRGAIDVFQVINTVEWNRVVVASPTLPNG